MRKSLFVILVIAFLGSGTIGTNHCSPTNHNLQKHLQLLLRLISTHSSCQQENATKNVEQILEAFKEEQNLKFENKTQELYNIITNLLDGLDTVHKQVDKHRIEIQELKATLSQCSGCSQTTPSTGTVTPVPTSEFHHYI